MPSSAPLHTRYDAVIVGARCAGAATAMLLARRGLRVLALERSAYGTDTLSTHALMRGGVLQLARWGLLDAVRASDTPAVRTTTFHYGSELLALAIKPRGTVDALYAPRRTLLDALLVDAARAAGAEVRHGVRVAELVRAGDGRVRGVVIDDGACGPRAIDAEIVIGADGIKSQVARLAGAQPYVRGSYHAAITYGYFAGLPADGYHWHYAPNASAGVIPTGGGLNCVFVALPPERQPHDAHRPDGFARALREAAPELASALRGARQVGPLRPFAGLSGYLRQSHGPGWALVGDAGHFKDPITAHGITDALRDAELLARAVASGRGETGPARYQRERDASSLRLFEISDAIASFAWDLDAVKALHVELAEEMAREVRMLTALDAGAEAA